MRKLTFRRPYKVTGTRISEEYLNEPGQNYERHLSVATKFGVVMVSEIKWEGNSSWFCCTHFSTVFNGLYYSATLDEAKLTDIRIKWLSTNFIKTIIRQST